MASTNLRPFTIQTNTFEKFPSIGQYPNYLLINTERYPIINRIAAVVYQIPFCIENKKIKTSGCYFSSKIIKPPRPITSILPFQLKPLPHWVFSIWGRDAFEGVKPNTDSSILKLPF